MSHNTNSPVAAPVPPTSLPLKMLFASAHNVRQEARSPEVVRSMALSIHAFGGVLQNLVVVLEVVDGKPTGRAGVAAGETRRLALLMLAGGEIEGASGYSGDYPVPVKVITEEEALAASTTENIQRTAMHPADEFEAFSKVYEQVGSAEAVAEVFGVSPILVRQRLKLSNASPRMLKLYRAGDMELEQLMALVLTDDHRAQEQLWSSTNGRPWARSPAQLRAALTSTALSVGSALVKFVGLETYVSAGGPIRHDLFAEDDGHFVEDVELLKTLASDKLERIAAPVRKEGWAWIEVIPDSGFNAYSFARAEKTPAPLDDGDQQRAAEIRQRMTEIERELDALYEAEDGDDDDDQDLGGGLRAELAQLRSEWAALRSKRGTAWHPSVLGLSGCVVTVDSSGKAVIHRGLVKPEHKKAAAKAAALAARWPAAASEDSARGAPGAQPPVRSAESEALTRRLTAHRTVALQRVLVGNTQAALATLAHAMVRQVLDLGRVERSALTLTTKSCLPDAKRYAGEDIMAARSWQELVDLCEGWRDRMPDSDLLPWLINLPTAELCELIALCTALSLDCVQSRCLHHEADTVASAVGLDMADWWEPSAAHYLSCVSKAQISAALNEAGMPAEATAIAGLKKAESVGRAEAALAGKRWLPVVLRSRDRVLAEA